MWTHIQEQKAPKHPVLSMTDTQLGLNIAVISKTGGTAKQLQKTACVQAGIHMKTLQTYACYQDKESEGVLQQLGQYQLLASYIDVHKQHNIHGLFVFESIQSISGHNNNPDFPVFKSLNILSSAAKNAWECTLQIMIIDSTFFQRSHL